ncbi:MAG: hypothetical protein ACR2MN_16625 [Acidimicrobiales bacterium]
MRQNEHKARAVWSASVTQQGAENTAVANVTPTGGYLTANLVTAAGEIDLSQQLLDRAGPESFDQLIHAQLMTQLYTDIDAYCIAQAIAGGGTVTSTGATLIPGLWGDVAKAGANMLTAPGQLRDPTHLFMTPTWHQYATAQVDLQNRPLMTPVPAGADLPITSPDGATPVGYTGERILTTAVFRDGNIPAAGANTQMLVAHMPEVFTLVSEPALDVFPETLAGSLSVVARLYAFVGVIVRHTAAVQTVTGTLYPAAPTFA